MKKAKRRKILNGFYDEATEILWHTERVRRRFQDGEIELSEVHDLVDRLAKSQSRLRALSKFNAEARKLKVCYPIDYGQFMETTERRVEELRIELIGHFLLPPFDSLGGFYPMESKPTAQTLTYVVPATASEASSITPTQDNHANEQTRKGEAVRSGVRR